MKLLYFYILAIFPLLLFSQKNQIIPMIDGTHIKNGIYLKSTPNGWTFVNKEGTQYYKTFKSVFSINDGMIRVEENQAGEQQINNSKGKTADIREVYILEIMKQLRDIVHYDFTSKYIRVGSLGPYFDSTEYTLQLDEYSDAVGYAYSQDGKFAKINKRGDILTDFKYDMSFRFFTIINEDKTKETYSVKLDDYSGKEIFKTKDSLVNYWNNENYIVKDIKLKKYLFTYKSHTYTVPEEFAYIIGLPIKSEIFTYIFYNHKKNILESGFIRINGEKLKTDLKPLSIFFKGHCIVKEETTDSLQKTTTVFKIVNERLKKTKTLTNIQNVSRFNKYGNIIIGNFIDINGNSRSRDYVINYKGNKVIPPVGNWNIIKEVSEGIYDFEMYNFEPTEENPTNCCSLNKNYYDQNGKKLFELTGEIQMHPIFVIGKKFNYIRDYYNEIIMLTLDKENKVIKSVL